jgi:hypothetical protein
MSQPLQNAGFANLTAAWVAYTTRPLYLGWGTGSAAIQSANALTAAAAEARTTGTSTAQTTTITNDTYQVVGTITCATAGKSITEVGVFDASTSGNMDIYGWFTAVALNVGDSIAFTVKVAFS